MKNNFIKNLLLVCFVVLFVVTHYFVLKNMYLLSRDVLIADYSIEKVSPSPFYSVERIPITKLTRAFGAAEHLAMDFAQVYFPARHFDELEQNYLLGRIDPAGRPSRYAPLVHFVCLKTYCSFGYGLASLIHLHFQLLLFFLIFVYSFKVLRIVKYLPAGILLINVCLFLTPAGISWFERGQFSLFVASAYLLIILGLLKRRPLFIVLSALLAYVKWTSFPTISIILLTFVIASGSFKEFRMKLSLGIIFPIVILLLLVFYPDLNYFFLKGVYQQEVFSKPEGVSLVKLIPVTYVKFTPIVLIFIALLYFVKYRNILEEYLPFFGGAGIVMLTYPTKAFEYNVSTMLGFVVVLIYWSSLAHDLKLKVARVLILFTLLLFLLVASNSMFLTSVFKSEYAIFFLYLGVAIVLCFFPLVFHFPDRQDDYQDSLGITKSNDF